MLSNQLITFVAANQSLADAWVFSNVGPYYRETKIRYLLVGNEIHSLPDKSACTNLVSATRQALPQEPRLPGSENEHFHGYGRSVVVL